MSEYYMFKEEFVNEVDEVIYLTPRDNPMEYEFPINFIFTSLHHAEEWIREQAEDWGVEQEEYAEWVVVRITEEKVGRVAAQLGF